MKRVLLYYLFENNKYTYISRIADNYIIPSYTEEGYFVEGIIINGDVMVNYIIKIPLRNEILAHYNNREFIRIT